MIAKSKGGRPKGRKNNTTITREAAEEALRQIVLREMEGMTAAQVANAKGIKYLVVREKRSGKFLRVGKAMARAKQGSTEETIEVWEKDPNILAFTDLMNRAIGKPKESQDLNVSGNVVHVFRWKGEDD